MGSKFWANVALCVFLGVVLVLGLTSFSSALTPKGLFIRDPQPSPEIAPLFSKVKLASYRLGEEKGHMVKAEFYVRNESDKDIKNVNVRCEFFDKNGKYVDRKIWLLAGTIPAGQAGKHSSMDRRFVNTRAGGLRCRITDFQIAEAPFFQLHRVEEGGHHGEAAEGHGEAMTGHGEHGHAEH